MVKVESYRDLVVWQRSIQLVKAVHFITCKYPRDERFRLVDQMLRAAASVPANIAEGFGRGQTRDFLRFLAIAKGSLNELETYLVIGLDLGYASAEDIQLAEGLGNEVGKMLTALRRSLQARLKSQRRPL